MADKLVNGDYAFISGTKKLQQCDYIDELTQGVQLLLTAGRGRFYPDKDFGIRVLFASDVPESFYLQSYAQQAVDTLDGVYVKSGVKITNSKRFNVIINDTERTVSIKNENNI